MNKKECATCKHWQPGKTDEAVRALKLANCRLSPRWTFLPPQGRCESHSPASEKAVTARAAWLGPMYSELPRYVREAMNETERR